MKKWLIGLTCVGMWAGAAMGAGEVSLTSATYTENFDSMGTNSTASLPAGYKFSPTGGAATVTWTNQANLTAASQAASSGSPTAGGRYNWGATGGTDRAPGFLTSSGFSSPNAIVVGFANNTGITVTQILASCVWEQYREAGRPATNTVYFSTDGTTWGSALASNVYAGLSVTNYGYPLSSNVVSITVPNLSIAAGATFYLQFRVNTGGSNSQGLGLDDVALILQPGGAPVYNVSFNKSSGFTVEQGSSDAIMATAANGTAPYTYGWSSTLGGTYYTASTNVFTILSTAPTGSYSATVVATDSSGPAQNVTNTINFSVVPPAISYPITITPPVNGTVTTTPASNAVAGATVTINATPDSGFAVGTLTVLDAGSNSVTVTGHTFTMPASAAIVTVTFTAVVAEGIVDFRFNTAPYLQVTVKDANLAVSDMALTTGTIETNITTGTYFPDEPYIEETGGWAVSNQAGAKAFLFTITPETGASLTIDGISFRAYATAAGPSAFGFDIGGGMATYEVNAPEASLLVVSQAVAGVASQTGPIVVKIQGWLNGSRTSAGSGVFRLDDVVIHGSVSTGPVAFSVSVNRTNGFTVEQGSSSTITATAANGTAPYTYGWSSSLAESAASTNVFTILSTAPTGSYWAQVVATDSSGPAQNATNLVTFSVVAPAPKYAITITPPVNGTVTTTPATNAAAGVTVTINATPAGGYAVDTITVVGADLSPVTVTGTTFTMPAQAVTVTVTFKVYVAPDILLDFETNSTLSTSTYAAGTSTVNSISFAHQRVLRGNAANDKVHGVYAGRLYPQGGTNAFLYTTAAFAQPITKINFWYANYGTENGTTFQVQVSPDGSTWTDVGSAFDPEGTNLTEAVLDTIPANSTYIQFITVSGTTRVNLDDIGIFFGSPAFSVSVNRTNGFTVAQGSSDAITATAANGTPSYGYSWGSTLGASYYTAVANVFTILATAPTGSYSATVTATDSVAQVAQKTVTFSVTGAGPGTPKVIVGGSLSGTVGVQMDLTITLTNGTAADWYIDLKDPDNGDVTSYNFNSPPTFFFTPAKVGTYHLTATAVDGSDLPIAATNVALTVSASGGNPVIPPITFVVGTGFTFSLPDSRTLNRVEGATTLVGQAWNWATLANPADYTQSGSTITIKSSVGSNRMIRIWVNP
jgi:hypothetical protein